MAQIRVSDETYAEIVRVKARLEELTGRHLTFCDTLKYLCEMFHENYREGKPLRVYKLIRT
ncbi:MAG: hypothetical protein NZ988_03870 [Thaumarchaeota archaeon]|nr:hypothetical protein [Candidatus Calditenuaceae archaeon]MDW8187167.1 hypothetical protein [Nitrososphaerota archaeon]